MASALELYLWTQVNNPQQLVFSTVLTSSQASISIPVPSGFNHLQGIYTARKDVGGGGAFTRMQFNGDTSNHYQWVNQIGNTAPGNSGASLVGFIQMGLLAGASDSTGYFATGTFTIGNVSSSSIANSMTASATLICSGTTYYQATFGGARNQAIPITSLTFMPDAGNFVAGTAVSVYGWR